MSQIPGLRGLRHIALKVRDVAQAKRFYQEVLGMGVVWEPDDKNVYLSSGCDNLAIHEVTDGFAHSAEERQLDHLGFIILASSSRAWTECASWSRNSSIGASRSYIRSRSIAAAARRFIAPIRMASSFKCFTSRS